MILAGQNILGLGSGLQAVKSNEEAILGNGGGGCRIGVHIVWIEARFDVGFPNGVYDHKSPQVFHTNAFFQKNVEKAYCCGIIRKTSLSCFGGSPSGLCFVFWRIRVADLVQESVDLPGESIDIFGEGQALFYFFDLAP